MNTYERFFSSAAAQMKESAIRRMGTMIAARREVISFAPGYPAPDTFAWDEFREIVDGLLNSRDPGVSSTDRPAVSGPCSKKSPPS